MQQQTFGIAALQNSGPESIPCIFYRVIFAAVQNLYNDGAVNIAFTLLLSVYLLTMLMIKQVHL